MRLYVCRQLSFQIITVIDVCCLAHAPKTTPIINFYCDWMLLYYVLATDCIDKPTTYEPSLSIVILRSKIIETNSVKVFSSSVEDRDSKYSNQVTHKTKSTRAICFFLLFYCENRSRRNFHFNFPNLSKKLINKIRKWENRGMNMFINTPTKMIFLRSIKEQRMRYFRFAFCRSHL